MTIANHDLGQTSVDELSPEGAKELFNRRCQDELGISAAEFLRAQESGSYPDDWDIASISRVEFLLPFAK